MSENFFMHTVLDFESFEVKRLFDRKLVSLVILKK